MLVLLIAAGCVMAVTSQQLGAGPMAGRGAGPMRGMLHLGRGLSINLATMGTPNLQSICKMAVATNGVNDGLSDMMGTATRELMTRSPTFSLNPLAMGGQNAKWQCLIGANTGNTAGGISDYFDTVPELKRIIPFFDPCDTVFCGEGNLTPVQIASEVIKKLRFGAHMGGRLSMGGMLNMFGKQASQVQNFMNQRKTTMGGMGSNSFGMGGMGSNSFGMGGGLGAALGRLAGLGGGRMAGLGGGRTSGGMPSLPQMPNPGMANMLKMAQILSGKMPSVGGLSNVATATNLNSAAGSSTNPASASGTTGTSGTSTNAASQSAPATNPVSSLTNNAPVNPSPQSSTNPFASVFSPNKMRAAMQQLQQLSNQMKGVGMGGGMPNQPQTPTASTSNAGTGMTMPNMGMRMPNSNMGMRMPSNNMGMGMPSTGMGIPGMGMGGMGFLGALAMGEAMADIDPMPRGGGMGMGMPGMGMGLPGMGTGLPGMGMGMQGLGMQGMGLPAGMGAGMSGMGMSGMGMPAMGMPAMGSGIAGLGRAMSSVLNNGFSMGTGMQPQTTLTQPAMSGAGAATAPRI